MLGHGPIRSRRRLRRRNSRRRSARRGAGRRAAAAVAPARRAAFRADQPTVGTDVSVLGAAADNRRCRRRRGFDAAFFAGASLALLDQILRLDPPFAGALRQRLALRAATACAALARHREDSSALRDAEHLSPNAGGNAPTSPAGRVHRLWRLFASPPLRARAPTLRTAADFLDLPGDMSFEGVADALREVVAGAETPLAAAAGASAAAMELFRDAPRASTPRFSRSGCPTSPWRNDLAGTRRFRCSPRRSRMRRRVAARQAATSRRSGLGRTPLAGAYAVAAREAFVLAGELSRRSQRCWPSSPNCGPRAPVGSSNFCLATMRSRRRPRRRRQDCRIAPAVVCSTGWSSSAPFANSPAGRIFGSMDCSVFAQSGNRFARRKRVRQGM